MNNKPVMHHKISKIKIFFNTIIQSFFLILIAKYSRFPKYDFNVLIKEAQSLLFCVITSDQSSWRAHQLVDYIRSQSLLLDVVFFTSSNTTYGGLNTIVTNPQLFDDVSTFPQTHQHTRASTEMLTKLIEMFDYFIHKTSHTHMIRMTDDVWINSQLIHQFIRELNPSILYPLGACFVHKNNFAGGIIQPILQGGSGMIFTRKLAEKMLSNKFSLLTHINSLDDWIISSEVQKYFPDFSYYSSDHMLGTGLSPQQQQKILQRKNWTVVKCPSSEPATCNKHIIPLRELVFVHQYGNPNYPVYEKIVWNAPPEIGLFSQKEFYLMCNTTYSGLDYYSGNHFYHSNSLDSQVIL